MIVMEKEATLRTSLKNRPWSKDRNLGYLWSRTCVSINTTGPTVLNYSDIWVMNANEEKRGNVQ